MKISSFFPLILFLMLIGACATPPDYPVEPIITFEQVSKDTLRRAYKGNIFLDSTFITFSFTDGDGDIGATDSLQLFVKDSRDNFISDYRIPYVLELGASNGIKGKITVQILTSCCIFPPASLALGCEDELASMPYDEIIYSIYIRDRAGHESNTIQTDPIYIQCFE